MALCEKVQEAFDPEQNTKDLAILYELTGFQGDLPPDDQEFWAEYATYKVLGEAQIELNEGINDAERRVANEYFSQLSPRDHRIESIQ